MVVRHGEALLANRGDIAMAHADQTEPATVLDHPEVRRVRHRPSCTCGGRRDRAVATMRRLTALRRV